MVYKTKLAAYMNKLDKQLLDKGSAYRVIRSMCSPQLNAILVVDTNFIAVTKTDPLALQKNREGNPEKGMTRSHGLTKENLLLSQALEERKKKTGRQNSNVTTAASSDISRKGAEAKRKTLQLPHVLHLPP
jgi:hypothetical protein